MIFPNGLKTITVKTVLEKVNFNEMKMIEQFRSFSFFLQIYLIIISISYNKSFLFLIFDFLKRFANISCALDKSQKKFSEYKRYCPILNLNINYQFFLIIVFFHIIITICSLRHFFTVK